MTGPGAYAREPYVMRQASTTSGDIWADDVEHSPQFMQAIMNGTPISELRRKSADDAVMRARREQASPVMWHTRDGKAVMDGSVTAAPEQQSVEHRQWTDFSDHQPPLPKPPPTGQEPDFMTARRHAGQLPARPPEGPVVRGL